MRRVIDHAPERWTVELVSGDVLEVWADAYGREGDHYTFETLVDLEPGDVIPRGQVGSGVSEAWTVSRIVARIPKSAVRHDESAPSLGEPAILTDTPEEDEVHRIVRPLDPTVPPTDQDRFLDEVDD